MRRFATVSLAVFLAVTFAVLSRPPRLPGTDAESSAPDPAITRIFFLRHAEEQVELLAAGGGTFAENCIGTCCVEVLNPLGRKRAELLAVWFGKRNLLPRITHVFASHKIRTAQTGQPIAAAAIEEGASLAEDADSSPGDGVQQLPPFVDECAPGFTSARTSQAPMIEALTSLPTGSVAVVAAHSATIYPIMEALGVDTSDPVSFPRTPAGTVSGVNNLWEVRLDAGGQGRLQRHLVLDFELARQHSDPSDYFLVKPGWTGIVEKLTRLW
jgi:phosphohistidine phosphatase SixA